jgi:hypothetical protein
VNRFLGSLKCSKTKKKTGSLNPKIHQKLYESKWRGERQEVKSNHCEKI